MMGERPDMVTVAAATWMVEAMLGCPLGRDIVIEPLSDTSRHIGAVVVSPPPPGQPWRLLLRADAGLEVLAHEAIHVAQLASGRLRWDTDMMCMYWLGSPYRGDSDPWEDEALSGEDDLASSYRASYGATAPALDQPRTQPAQKTTALRR